MKLTVEGQCIGDVYLEFSDYDSIDGEFIIYNNKNNKIITLNITATSIFKRLMDSAQSKVDSSDVDILLYMKSIFNIGPDKEDAVLRDIQKVLYQFLKEGVIARNDIYE